MVAAALFFASIDFWPTAQQPFRFALLTVIGCRLGCYAGSGTRNDIKLPPV